MSSPQEWINAVERKLRRKLSDYEKETIDAYVAYNAIGSVNDEDVIEISRDLTN